MVHPAETADYHEGPVTYRASADGKYVLVLCCFGHIVDEYLLREWVNDRGKQSFVNHAGGTIARCYGKLPELVLAKFLSEEVSSGHEGRTATDGSPV